MFKICVSPPPLPKKTHKCKFVRSLCTLVMPLAKWNHHIWTYRSHKQQNDTLQFTIGTQPWELEQCFLKFYVCFVCVCVGIVMGKCSYIITTTTTTSFLFLEHQLYFACLLLLLSLNLRIIFVIIITVFRKLFLLFSSRSLSFIFFNVLCVLGSGGFSSKCYKL